MVLVKTIFGQAVQINDIPTAFWHYDGSAWSKFCDVSINGYEVIIQSIAGSTPNNIYAVGYADSTGGDSYKAIIFHFNGSTWEQVNIPIIRNSFYQIFFDENSGKFLINGWTLDTITQYIYSFDGKSINNILSNEDGFILSTISKNIYSTTNGKLFKYINGDFSLFRDFSATNYASGTIGRSEKDFFTTNWDGIGHFNGTDLITIYQKRNNDWFPDGWIVFEKDVFFIRDDSFNTLVIHGKLKD